MILKLIHRNVYGVDRFYPANEPASILIHELMGVKTLTLAQIELIEKMGLDYKIEDYIRGAKNG